MAIERSKTEGDGFRSYIFFSKTFKNQNKTHVLRVLGAFRHAEFENAVHFLKRNFDILLIWIFKIHSPAEIFLNRIKFAHTLTISDALDG